MPVIKCSWCHESRAAYSSTQVKPAFALCEKCKKCFDQAYNARLAFNGGKFIYESQNKEAWRSE